MITIEQDAIAEFGAQTVADFVQYEHDCESFADVVEIYNGEEGELWSALWEFKERWAADNGALGVGS